VAQDSIYILCIETANAVTSVAISKNGNCLHSLDILEPNKAADTLHTLIKQLLEESKLTFTNIHAVAISAGPGSYTGLRIAAAAAKGFCYALDIPLIAISTLQAMVHGVQTRYHQTNFDEYVPMIDARRMEVFTSFFSKDLTTTFALPSLIIDENAEKLFHPEKKYLLFGNGANKTVNTIIVNTIVVMNDFQHCSKDLCLLALTAYNKKETVSLAYFEPNYTKAFYTTARI